MADDVCGESVEHDEECVYEDAESATFVCRRCGAEWWEDRD